MSATAACVSREGGPLRRCGREVGSGVAPVYARHRPEQTLLYPLVQEYSPALKASLSAQGTRLPGYVEQAFGDYLKCGWLEQGLMGALRTLSCRAPGRRSLWSRWVKAPESNDR